MELRKQDSHTLITEWMGREVSTVQWCWQQWTWEGGVVCSDQAKCMDAHVNRHIRLAAIAYYMATAIEIIVSVAPGVSSRTIQNCLLGVGLYVPLAQLPLTSRHCLADLQWCHQCAWWRKEQ